jgi:pSer/pThr/pTyr-binding forkhead associated (FHA) protein
VVTGTVATVEDLGSKNGTTIGDRRVRGETALVDGDRLHIASVLVEVRFAGLVESTRTVSRHTSASSGAGS